MKKNCFLSVLTGLCLLFTPIAEAAVDKVICVPWQGDIYKSHTAIDGQTIRLKAVIKTTDNTAIWYKWDFGDGSESTVVSLTGRTKYNVEIDHMYNGVEDTPFTARLLVSGDDTFTNPLADNYLVAIAENKLDSRINIAIDNGLWYLYKTGGNGSSNYHTFDNSPLLVWSYSAYYASPTASAIQAFEINGHRETGNPDQDPYAEAVDHGLNWLLKGYVYNGSYPMLRAYAIGLQRTDDPDSNGNGIGIEVRDYAYRPIYEGGMIIDALVATGTPDADSGRDFDGDGTTETYRDIIQDMVDMYSWGQYDGTSSYGILGGWRYNWNSWPDNSAAQWAAIGLIPVQKPPWNIPVAEWVKSYNDNWLDYSHYQWNNDGTGNIWGGFGYTSSGWGYARTPSGMVQLDFVGAETSDPRWVRCERWLADNWLTGSNWLSQNNVYAYYSFAKAMRLANPEPVVTFSSNNFDWYRGDTKKIGLAQKISDRLISTHYWDYYGRTLGTAWAVIVLRPTLFTAAPIACFDADPNPNYPNQPINFDPSCSDHSEQGKNIDNLTLFEWDWDNDGIYDTTTTTPGITAQSFECETIPCVYPISLRVTDDSDPARTATYVKNISITYPPHPPVAVMYSPYMVSMCEGDTLKLDGSSSYDPDEGEHEGDCDTCPGDTLTAWEWDLTGAPFDYTDSSGKTVDLGTNFTDYFPGPGRYNIGLRVTDNTELAYPSSSAGNLTDEGFASVEVYDECLCEIEVTPMCLAVKLEWADIGADMYYYYKSSLGPNLGFEDLGRTTDTTKYAGSFVMDKTHWYRVVAEKDGNFCMSKPVEVYGEASLCNPTVDTGGPYSACSGETVTLDGSASTALAGTIITWEWDLDNDGEYDDAFGEQVEHVWTERGQYTVGLQVTSSDSLVLKNEASTIVEIDYDPSCAQNWTDEFENCDLFMLGDVSNIPDTCGCLAAGGDVFLTDFQLNNTTRDDIGLVVEGDLTLSGSGFVYGDIYHQGLADISPNVTVSGNIYPDTDLFDFATEEQTMIARSAYLSRTPPTGLTEIIDTCWFYLSGSETDLNIFNLPYQPQIQAPCGINITAPAGSAIVINVPGESPQLGDLAIVTNDITAEDILWNFHEATSLYITNMLFQGTLLAPYAEVTLNSCHINGSIYAAALSSPDFHGEVCAARFVHWDNICDKADCLQSCDDGVQNQGETDIDCGGDSCPGTCTEWQMCVENSDCTGGLCDGGLCQPTCTDNIQNQDETGIDCGGICGATCELGTTCSLDEDCTSNYCEAGICTEPPVSGCSEATAIDLGAPGVETTVANDACVMIRDGYPTWWTGPDMRLDTTGTCDGTVPFTWINTCAGGSGSDSFTGPWQQHTIGPASKDCATLIDLQGTGGNISLRWY